MTDFHSTADFTTRIENLAKGASDAELEQHIASCTDCQDELVAIRSMLGLQEIAPGGLQSPPEYLVTGLQNLMAKVRPDLVRTTTLESRNPLTALKRIVADLLHDSSATPQLAGLRGESDSRTRQMSFVSDVADLDLEITPKDANWLVSGQLGMDVVPAGLKITFDSTASDTGPINGEVTKDGYFQVTLPSGDWSAAIAIQDAVVQFQGIGL